MDEQCRDELSLCGRPLRCELLLEDHGGSHRAVGIRWVVVQEDTPSPSGSIYYTQVSDPGIFGGVLSSGEKESES